MIEGTSNLLAAAKEEGISRFVLMSALGTTKETKDLVPYYNAKWTEEQQREGFRPQARDLPAELHLRPGGGILPTFNKLAKIAPVTGVIGSGEQRIQPIWVETSAAYFAQGGRARGGEPDVRARRPRRRHWNEFWRGSEACSASGADRCSTCRPALMRIPASVTERLPGNIPLTGDLLKMLEAGDNVVSNDDAARTFHIPLIPLDEQLRAGGRLIAAERAAAAPPGAGVRLSWRISGTTGGWSGGSSSWTSSARTAGRSG